MRTTENESLRADRRMTYLMQSVHFGFPRFGKAAFQFCSTITLSAFFLDKRHIHSAMDHG